MEQKPVTAKIALAPLNATIKEPMYLDFLGTSACAEGLFGSRVMPWMVHSGFFRNVEATEAPNQVHD